MQLGSLLLISTLLGSVSPAQVKTQAREKLEKKLLQQVDPESTPALRMRTVACRSPPCSSSGVASEVWDLEITPNLEFSFQMLPTRYCSVRPCPVK